MKKQQEQQTYGLENFENHCNLYSIIPGGQGKGIVQLRKILDSIHANNYSRPGSKLPSILITGVGKKLAATALTNSLSLIDVRICSSKYLDNGISSNQFFENSTSNCAHIITNIEHLTNNSESVLWRYLAEGKCSYYNYITRQWDITHYCNGLILLTANDSDKISKQILKEIDYVVRLEPLTADQRCLVVHLQLKFCGIEHDGEQVLQAIVGNYPQDIRHIMQFLKMCIMVLRTEMEECMSMAIVEKASRLSSLPVPPPAHKKDDIPF